MSYIIQDNEFNNITDKHTRMMLKNAYKAIDAVEAWNWLKNFNDESFMSSRDPMMSTIVAKMEALGYSSHSGSSLGCTMRYMELLAKQGKTAFFDSFK